MLLNVLIVLSLLTTLYLVAHLPAAMYVKSKNPSATISVKPPAYVIPALLWVATLVTYIVV